MCDGPDIFLVLLSILFPPVGVWVKRGLCSADSLINIALCCLGYLPGLIHSWYIISRYPESNPYERVADSEGGGQVQYYYVASGPGGQQGGYGTISAAPAPAAQFPGQQQSGVANQQSSTKAFTQPSAKSAPAGASSLPSVAAHTSQPPSDGAAAGPSSGGAEPAPPSYDETIRGDHKVDEHSMPAPTILGENELKWA